MVGNMDYCHDLPYSYCLVASVKEEHKVKVTKEMNDRAKLYGLRDIAYERYSFYLHMHNHTDEHDRNENYLYYSQVWEHEIARLNREIHNLNLLIDSD